MDHPDHDDLAVELMALARRILIPRMPRDDAEDCVQDVLLSYWRAHRQSQPQDPPSYLARICFRTAARYSADSRLRHGSECQLDEQVQDLSETSTSSLDATVHFRLRIVGVVDSRTQLVVELWNETRSIAFVRETLGLSREQLLRTLRKIERAVAARIILIESTASELRGGDSEEILRDP